MDPADPDCICPHDDGPYGRLYGIPMGRGPMRISTMPGCPVHAACARYTAANRGAIADGAWLYCPVHGRTACPRNRA